MSSVSFCCSSFFPEQSKKRFARPEECPELPRPTLYDVFNSLYLYDVFNSLYLYDEFNYGTPNESKMTFLNRRSFLIEVV